MSFPRVSVIVTCYNLGAYLHETLESIRAQTFGAYELCVIDDGSADPLTQQVLRELAPDVRVVRSDNRGLSAARNLGVALTSAEYVCAVDADDLLAPTLLEKSVQRLDEDPSLAFVSHWLEAFGDQHWTWKPDRCDLATLLDFNSVNGAALVRRSALQAVGGWDETMRHGCEDWDLWITLIERGMHGDIIPEILFRYRRRSDSMSRVSLAGSGHSRRSARLVDKHLGSYLIHAPAIAARRDAAIAMNTALADDLEERLELELVPALSRARDDLASAEAARERYDREAERCRSHDQLMQENAALERARDDMEQHHIGQRDRLQDNIARLQSDIRGLQTEIATIRTSLSWRVTRPLRAFGGWLLRALPRLP